MNPKVDWFFNKATQWQEEYEKLRMIVLDCGLSEELKWGCPCYTLEKKNIVLIHGFKEYCALLFFKGAVLNDTHGILIQQTENVQAARQIRLTSLKQIEKMEPILKKYIDEAIEVEKSGLKVPMKKTKEFSLPFCSCLSNSHSVSICRCFETVGLAVSKFAAMAPAVMDWEATNRSIALLVGSAMA